jgi:hypothetical protein
MSSFYDCLSEVSNLRDYYTVVVRVIRCWTVKNITSDEPSLPIELILMDSKVKVLYRNFLFRLFHEKCLLKLFFHVQGVKIGASIHRSLWELFKNKIKEDNIYIISNVSATFNDRNIRSTKHKYHFNFNESTKVKGAFFIHDWFRGYQFEDPEALFGSEVKCYNLIGTILNMYYTLLFSIYIDYHIQSSFSIINFLSNSVF